MKTEDILTIEENAENRINLVRCRLIIYEIKHRALKPLICKAVCFFSLICLCALPCAGQSQNKKAIEERMMRLVTNGSVVLLDEEGKPLISHRADELFVPASIIKILTTTTDWMASMYFIRSICSYEPPKIAMKSGYNEFI